MNAGYLYLETHPDYPELIRVSVSSENPVQEAHEDGVQLRYAARFRDRDAARMHLHECLRHRLVDVDKGLYRCSLLDAMAVIEAEDLSHERVWIDHTLEQASIEQFEKDAEQRQQHSRLVEKIWRLVGIVALVLLGLNLIGVL